MKKQNERQPKVVVVANTKGGVGKSLVSQHIAPYILDKGEKHGK